MSEPILTARQLNRATLARQLLLERVELDATTAVQRLAALQAQEAASPYLALWTRISGFEPGDLDAAFAERRVVKATAMRVTLHAMTSSDLTGYWPAIAGSIRAARDRTQAWPPDAASLDDIAAQVTAAAAQPRTGVELRALADRLAALPDALPNGRDPWRGVRLSVPFVIVPDGGPWSFGRRPVFQAADVALGTPMLSPEAGADLLVRRYLSAFGPASVADLAAWTRVERGRLKPAFERLAPELRRFRNEAGALLFDVTDGPLPAADTPAPPRLLPMWDSVLLAYADRSRIVPEAYRRRVVMSNGDYLPCFLVDGLVAGLWRSVDRNGKRGIELEPFHPLGADDLHALEAEAGALATFVAEREPGVYRRYTEAWARRRAGRQTVEDRGAGASADS
jgi:hypothetical protein